MDCLSYTVEVYGDNTDLEDWSSSGAWTTWATFCRWNVWIGIKISLKFVYEGLVVNDLILVHVKTCVIQATSHYLNQWWPCSLWCVSVSPGLDMLTHYSPGDVAVISKCNIQIIQNISLATPVKLHWVECHRIVLMRSQHWFRLWLGAIRHQAIIWANFD